MVRISDILKHRDHTPEPELEKKEVRTDLSPPQSPTEKPPEYIEKTEIQGSEGVKIAKAMDQEQTETESRMQMAKAMHQMQIDPEESRRIYNRAWEVIKFILDKITSEGEPPDIKDAYELVKTMVDRIVLGDKELILCATNYSADNYLYAHSVNVCIYAIDMGLAFGYNKSKLNEIGLGALLHDVGMSKFAEIAQQPRKLTSQEYSEIKKHPLNSGDILGQIKDIHEEVIYIAKYHHERLNGRGYPDNLEDGQIQEYAQIVGIVDVYEALTHPRAYREAFSPHEAVKELLRLAAEEKFLEIKLIKMLISRVGLYPVGSWVELNSGEIGKVIASNDDFPLRPKVNIIFEADRKKLPKMKLIDLAQHTNLYIKQSADPKKLNLKLE